MMRVEGDGTCIFLTLSWMTLEHICARDMQNYYIDLNFLIIHYC